MPELNLYQLRVFYTVARLLSYSKAGEELALSQPAVSRQVSALEKNLELQLFSRQGRQVELTGEGRTLFDYADKIFELAEEAERAMEQYKDLERGQVAIGASRTMGSYVLPVLVHNFNERHPQIDTILHIRNSETIEQLVAENKVDLGLVRGTVKTPSLYIEPYMHDELLLLASPEHPLTNKKEVSLKDLENETLIWRESGSALRAAVEQFLSKNDTVFKKKIEIDDTEAIKQMTTSNAGVAFIPKTAVTLGLSIGTIKTITNKNFPIPLESYIISCKDRHYYPTVLAFLNFLRKSLNSI